MPGIDSERSSENISLLGYFQDRSTQSWNSHTQQHDLEQRALNLAVGRVEKAMSDLERLLDQKITSNRTSIDSNLKTIQDALVIAHAELDRRSEERDRAAREIAEDRIVSTERWMKDVLDARWESHNLHHDEHETARLRDAVAWRESHVREHTLIQLAVDKASITMNDRLESMNAFRAQLDKMVATLVTSSVLDARLLAVATKSDVHEDQFEKRLAGLERSRANLEGRFAALSAILVIGLGVVEFVLRQAGR